MVAGHALALSRWFESWVSKSFRPFWRNGEGNEGKLVYDFFCSFVQALNYFRGKTRLFRVYQLVRLLAIVFGICFGFFPFHRCASCSLQILR